MTIKTVRVLISEEKPLYIFIFSRIFEKGAIKAARKAAKVKGIRKEAPKYKLPKTANKKIISELIFLKSLCFIYSTF